MSKKPNCAIGKVGASCCSYVKICYQNRDSSKQILKRKASEVTEYKRPNQGSSQVERFWQMALKMHLKGPNCTVDEGLCI